MIFIPRPVLHAQIERSLRSSPVVALLGARQTGKTTLARAFAIGRTRSHIFDLERAADTDALAAPELALAGLKGLIIIDEIQRMPSLFTTLRPLADRRPLPARFLVLGSASPELVRGVSESLAGRISFVPAGGLSLDEAGMKHQNRLWVRGGFPRSYTAPSDAASFRWRQAFIRTFLERDIPQLGIRIPAATMRRFWMMLAHYHGQVWNGSEMARSMGTNDKSVREYLDVLSGAFVVRVLPPWFENLGKRLVKSPKVYVRDSGLLHTLHGIRSSRDLLSHRVLGASWEGFALEHVLMTFGEEDAYFWSTYSGAELDLLLIRGGRRYGFEFKCSDAPRMTKSLRTAAEDLKLHRAWIVYPGSRRYSLDQHTEALPLAALPTLRLN